MAFLASRPMEDFFINPTVDMEDKTSTTPAAFGLYDSFPQHKRATSSASTFFSGKITPRSTAMASHKQSAASMSHIPEQPDYFHGYASEEEVASPVDVDDDFSYYSGEGSDSIGSAVTTPAYIAEAVQQCSRAQAVTLQPAGKPKMITLPKLDLSYRRTSRPTASFNEGRRGSRLRPVEEAASARSSQDSHSRNDSMDSSTANSPASTAPSSVDEEEHSQMFNRKESLRHKPLMMAAKEVSPIETIPRSATFPRQHIDPVARHSMDMSDRCNTPTSPSGSFRPSIRKMGKFSSIINLNLLGRDSKDNSETSSLYSLKGSDSGSVSQKVSQLNNTSMNRRSMSAQHKLVARGANERAPTLTLPPFPDE